ncbi:hypothetical protein pipiens_008707 [Culex pipiens pipiens]|uniref:Uncharacterized protein n=1 Tax=Culex pipiens pipiens TaxID=38569 RepID=A0ABD1DGU3_CULPP
MSYIAEEKIKLAGEDSKDRLYEAKQNQKAIRILTVAAYVLVSRWCHALALLRLSGPEHDRLAAKTQTVADNIVIPDHLAIQLANKSEVPAEFFYTNLYRNLIHSKTIKARKSTAINESANLTQLIRLYHLQRQQLEPLVEPPDGTQPQPSQDVMMADEDDGGDDYEQSGNYGLYSNHTTIQLDQDEEQQQQQL